MKREDLCEAVRHRLERLPAPHDAHYGVIPPPPPTLIDVTPVRRSVEAARDALARVKSLAQLLPDPYLLSRVLTRREAVSSSAIEGTNSTLDELLGVEETQSDDASTAAKQVRDYALALDGLVPHARELGSQFFTNELIQRLHRAVMAGASDYPDPPGAFRERVVWIGGGRDIAYSTYNPPPPARIAACLEENVAALRADDIHTLMTGVIARMAAAHAHFEAVHPFRDGNGRVGRLLLPLVMTAEGEVPLYLSPFIEANKPAYYDALKAAQQRLEWHVIVGFMADAVTATVAELEATQAALNRLMAIWRGRRRFRRESAAERALALLPHYPVITANRLADLLGVSFTAASQGIAALMEAGILVERTGYSRNRLFAAREALSIINRPFGAEPVLPPSPG